MDLAFEREKRQTLRLLAGIGVIGLSGCCTLRDIRPPSIKDGPLTASKIQPLLRPRRITASADKPPGYCLDAHAHFFNASDINIEGYWSKCIAHEIKPSVLKKLVISLTPIVTKLATTAPSAQEEYIELIAKSDASAALSLLETHAMFDNLATQKRNDIASALYREMVSQNVGDAYLEAKNVHARAVDGLTGRTREMSTQFTKAMVENAIDPQRKLATDEALFSAKSTTGFMAPPADIDDPDGYLAFIANMLAYRWMNLRDYQVYYTENDQAFGVDGVFGALVDFDYWLDCIPRSPREDQMKLQSLLSMMSGGYMLPLIAYNPWTDINDRDASIALVQKAIRDFGFVGVKIYPSVGYYPYGNKDSHNNSKGPHPADLGELDSKLAVMFDWCAKMGVPVMAHANESKGQDDSGDEYGGPAGWRALLKRYEGSAKPPFINVGHYGGDSPNRSGAWPEEFAGLMTQPGGTGANFYGDLGYWDKLMWCEDAKDKCKSVKDRLEHIRSPGSPAAERIMYGTDWFMSAKVPLWSRYPGELVKNLKGLLPMEAFLYSNTMHCFGLATGGAQRTRLLTHFNGLPGGPPKWLLDA